MVVFHSYVSLPEGNSDSHPFLLNSFFLTWWVWPEPTFRVMLPRCVWRISKVLCMFFPMDNTDSEYQAITFFFFTGKSSIDGSLYIYIHTHMCVCVTGVYPQSGHFKKRYIFLFSRSLSGVAYFQTTPSPKSLPFLMVWFSYTVCE